LLQLLHQLYTETSTELQQLPRQNLETTLCTLAEKKHLFKTIYYNEFSTHAIDAATLPYKIK